MDPLFDTPPAPPLPATDADFDCYILPRSAWRTVPDDLADLVTFNVSAGAV
ncbi:hypothetical protein JANAI62_03930 [Jannaschia pagri]|uniref:Uncharacterized protein n=1 Tax=Jannaschia pagri TaxID=2829797 RepID=A0ABQ4NH80_9RHOB|nr:MULTISPECIES: hypothetical protein [unclassified Jannaschia]GIT90124.1 hypothetical protein JANAI61_05820 [Jannaschia sp. AI_61]GIT93770.1 hypothetical protein JANAI62_03930 [Jannaschia sp. AI_62]